ncbi:hypothetical protein EDC01DRAFT_779303 [Geopyxis carbonaria]|nr:hypothetical protein EDC01DRAFT_779303 [Geopyxis carbonaria]
MRCSLLYPLLVLATSSLTLAATSCTAAGVAGTCIATSACSGTSTPGLCPGAANIQCCTKPTGVGTSCTISSGVKGTCKATSSCTGTSTPGFCPGASNIQCCTTTAPSTGSGGSCTISSGVSGTCKPTSSCTGTSTPGFCPGAANIQCCTAAGSSGGSGGGSLPGLNAKQSKYAQTIADVAHSYALPVRGCVVAIATAMQESTLRILANTGVPDSYNYPHDAEGSDHDSVGLFQQRPKFWCPGKTGDCMDPATSAGKFYAALKGVSGWQGMAIAKAAQSVQRSAYPDAYAKWESLATEVCAKAY